jgi:acyl-[acyl-carrier-protein]-phospholipid O-acyltransferase / long-chain-fatty-acid--[acyl-carrier-protein] ligase
MELHTTDINNLSLAATARKPGFVPLWASQCLLSFNDNCFKILVSMVAVENARRQGLASSDLPLVAAAFLAPFLLFSGIAGRLADTVSKPQLLRWMKGAEVLAMLAGTAALASNNIHAMLAVVFLMGLHSTFYGPARAGLTPELVGLESLAGANGLLDMGSYFSIVLGTLGGTLLFAQLGDRLWPAGVLLSVLAAIGFLCTLALPAGKAAAKASEARLIDGLKHLVSDTALARTVAGIASFWFLGALMQMLVLLLAKESLHVEEPATGFLLAALAVGIGVGSVLAGKLSERGIELGLLPVGAVGIVIGLFSLAAAANFPIALAALFATGLSAGLWIVPLDAYLQYRTKPGERGRIIGASSFINTLATLAAPGLLFVAQKVGIPVKTLLYIAAAYAFVCLVASSIACGRSLVRFVLMSIVRSIYRVRVHGWENIPQEGGALIIANHVTFVDGLLMASVTQRFVRFLVIEKHYNQFAGIMRFFHAIPVRQGRPRDVVQMIERTRQALSDGHVVCIFPEGDLTHTGNINEFQRGMERIVSGLDVPVIPVHLGGLWGSIFSFEGGRFLNKWPKQLPYPVEISIGQPLPNTTTAVEARQAVVELSAHTAERQAESLPLLHHAFLAAAKDNPAKQALADSSGKELSYRQALTGALLLSKQIRAMKGQMIGIVLPASVGGALANVACLMAGKTPVNLNFTSGKEAVDSAIAQCKIECILSSRLFLAKAKMEAAPNMVFLEDLVQSATKLQKALVFASTYLPGFVLRMRMAGGQREDLATVIFSSGSSGQPKGVMLSHQNIMSNIEACYAVISLQGEDRIAGVLPFFHSFGFTFTLWFPIVKGIGGVYHPNPLDAKGVGSLVEKHKATILLATPTFLSNYTRVVPQAQFGTLRLVLAGAEKLRENVSQSFAEKFGTTPREGYGATEMAPVIAVSTPDTNHEGRRQRGWAVSSVGRALPGVALRVVHAETRQAIPHGEEGLLLVKGPNQMMGYLGDSKRTEEAIQHGWYVTGDVAKLDEHGFVYLTGRLSRFSKIAGEMVPHGRVEEAIDDCLEEGAKCCVVALPDEDRGERLVALYEGSKFSAAEVATLLGDCDLPKLWLPKRDALFSVEALPTLGTGKLDLRRAKAMAESLLGVAVS